jgi:hypothetical protein
MSRSQSKTAFSLRRCALIILGAMGLGLATGAFGQEAPKPQTQTGTSAPGQAPSASSKVFFPDIAVSTKRLSAGKKFQLFAENSISLHTLAWAALGSAVNQADNSPTGYGQGWDAYAKRFGSSMGRQASSNFFGKFLLASALHQDPRFYPEVNPSFGQAVKYSVERVFVTRNDDGRDVANWSGLAGPAMAEGLANVYWPERNRTVGDTLLRYGLDLATQAGGNMLREYWPVFYGKIRHAPRPAGHN